METVPTPATSMGVLRWVFCRLLQHHVPMLSVSAAAMMVNCAPSKDAGPRLPVPTRIDVVNRAGVEGTRGADHQGARQCGDPQKRCHAAPACC